MCGHSNVRRVPRNGSKGHPAGSWAVQGAAMGRSNPDLGGCERHRGNRVRQSVDGKRQSKGRLRHRVDGIGISLARSSVGSRRGGNRCFAEECELCKTESSRPEIIPGSWLRQSACLCDVGRSSCDSGSTSRGARRLRVWPGHPTEPLGWGCPADGGTPLFEEVADAEGPAREEVRELEEVVLSEDPDVGAVLVERHGP